MAGLTGTFTDTLVRQRGGLAMGVRVASRPWPVGMEFSQAPHPHSQACLFLRRELQASHAGEPAQLAPDSHVLPASASAAEAAATSAARRPAAQRLTSRSHSGLNPSHQAGLDPSPSCSSSEGPRLHSIKTALPRGLQGQSAAPRATAAARLAAWVAGRWRHPTASASASSPSSASWLLLAPTATALASSSPKQIPTSSPHTWMWLAGAAGVPALRAAARTACNARRAHCAASGGVATCSLAGGRSLPLAQTPARAPLPTLRFDTKHALGARAGQNGAAAGVSAASVDRAAAVAATEAAAAAATAVAAVTAMLAATAAVPAAAAAAAAAARAA